MGQSTSARLSQTSFPLTSRIALSLAKKRGDLVANVLDVIRG